MYLPIYFQIYLQIHLQISADIPAAVTFVAREAGNPPPQQALNPEGGRPSPNKTQVLLLSGEVEG